MSHHLEEIYEHNYTENANLEKHCLLPLSRFFLDDVTCVILEQYGL